MVEQSLTQKVNKLEVNIKTHQVTYKVSCDLNLENLSISGLYIEQGLKVTTLYLYKLLLLLLAI